MSQVHQVARVGDNLAPSLSEVRVFHALVLGRSHRQRADSLQATGDKAVEVGDTTVTVSKPIKKPITEFVDFTGRTDAAEAVDRPAVPWFRLSGSSGSSHRQRAMVQQDQVLFQIDPQPYRLR